MRLPFASSMVDHPGEASSRVVEMFLRAGMKVVIDFHPDGAENSREEIWNIVYCWRNTARHFQNDPTDQLAFHILNEPRAHDCKDRYERLAQLACEAIWDITPDRLCIVSNHMMGNPDGWIQRPGGKPEIRFKMPTGGLVAAAMSYYRPYDSVEDPKKVAAPRGYPPVRLLGATSNSPTPKDFVFDDYQNMEIHFARFREYCDSLGIEGWVSEFGCHRTVQGRNQYAKDVLALCKKYNFGACAWAFQDEYGANPAFGNVKERDMDYWKIIKGAA